LPFANLNTNEQLRTVLSRGFARNREERSGG
jgi:hypothetical protein